MKDLPLFARLNEKKAIAPNLNENQTNKQTQVLQGVSAGETSKETAQRLEISVRTVDVYRKQIMLLIGAKNSLQACVLALKRGLLKRPKLQK